MKIEELKALIDKYTTDEGLNHEELNKDINAQFDALIDGKVTKAKASAKSENIEEFIKEQGFENLDQYNAFVKNTKSASNELTEKATRLETEYGAIKSEYEKLKAENESYTYLSKLDGVDDKFKKFALSEIKGLINDETDFDTAKTKYFEENPQYLKESGSQMVTKTPKGTTKTVQGDGVLSILEAKHNIKLE